MQKEVESLLRRRFLGNRSLPARILDYAALRLILFFAAYLFISQRIADRERALLLSGIALALGMLLIRMLREIRFARFVQKEREKTGKQLTMDGLMRMDQETLLAALRPLVRAGSTPVLFQCAESAGPDMLLFALRCGGGERITVFSTGGYTDAARAFAARYSSLFLVETEDLLSAAEAVGLSIGDEAVDSALLSRERAARAAAKARRGRAFGAGGALRYGLAAIVLTAASFFTGYALYYRLLAGFCGLCAGASALFFGRGQGAKAA